MPGLDDWDDAQGAMKRNELDIIFFSGVFDSKTVNQLADSTVILGLDDMSLALMLKNDHSIWPAKFPQNSYRIDIADNTTTPDFLIDLVARWKSLRHFNKSSMRLSDLKFCPDATATVSSRGLLVCSPQMTSFDAFQIAQAVQNNVQDVPFDDMSFQPSQDLKDFRSKDIESKMHPGALRLRTDHTFTTGLILVVGHHGSTRSF